jgi:hypothetical protein
MTTNHHTAISVGAAANAATINSPLGELDLAIDNLVVSGGVGHTILDEGVSLGQKTGLDFIGAGVVAANGAVNTEVTFTVLDITTYDPATIAEQVVGLTATQTLTNKTLTSPVVNTPTGIVKGDVGLGNVDNTSDATKDAAATSLTNKTIDADNNTISNLEHGAEVDEPSSGVHGVAGSVVGTSDSQTLTNKTLTAPVMTTPQIDTFEFGMGTSFPGTPGAGDLYYRTDLDFMCFYDGTRWLTQNIFTVNIWQTIAADATTYLSIRIRDDYAPYFERINITYFVATTNDVDNYWVLEFDSWTSTLGASTEIHNLSTSAAAADTYIDADAAPPATTQTPGNYGKLLVEATKTGTPGTPGNISVWLSYEFRLIVT